MPCFSPVGIVRLRPKTCVTSAGCAEVATSKSLAARAAQQVAHRAADEPGLEAAVAQLAAQLDDVRGNVERHSLFRAYAWAACRRTAAAHFGPEALGDLGGALVERGRAVGVAAERSSKSA